MTRRECIEQLNNINFSSAKATVQDLFYEIRRIAEEYGDMEDWFVDYIDEDDATRLVSDLLDNFGLCTAANCTEGLREFNGVYHLDGYENLEDVTYSELEDLRDGIIEELENEYDDDDEEEEE